MNQVWTLPHLTGDEVEEYFNNVIKNNESSNQHHVTDFLKSDFFKFYSPFSSIPSPHEIEQLLKQLAINIKDFEEAIMIEQFCEDFTHIIDQKETPNDAEKKIFDHHEKHIHADDDDSVDLDDVDVPFHFRC